MLPEEQAANSRYFYELVDSREDLHGGHVLHEHPLARQAHHGDRHRDGGEQDQPLGHHRHDAGDGPAHGLVERQVGAFALDAAVMLQHVRSIAAADQQR